MLELPSLENELQEKLINLINTGYLLAIKAEFEAEVLELMSWLYYLKFVAKIMYL